MNEVAETRIWCIRAGVGGDAHDLFIDENIVALSGSGLGDLSQLDNTRDAFYSTYRQSHPEETRTGSAGIAGKYFRFANEMSIGDVVLYPALRDKMVYIGYVDGDYTFCGNKNEKYPHRRSIKWTYVVPKIQFSQAARYELGAARTFFQLRRNAEEVMERVTEDSASQFQTKTSQDTN